MLVLEPTPNNFVPWHGEAINEIVYPLEIESLWDSNQLIGVGLTNVVEAESAPIGQHYVGEFTIARVQGVVSFVGTLESDPLPDLLPYQFFSMLALSGQQAALDSFFAALPEPQRTIATNKLNRSLSFQRTNSLVLAAQQALGLTDQQLDGLWLQASAIE